MFLKRGSDKPFTVGLEDMLSLGDVVKPIEEIGEVENCEGGDVTDRDFEDIVDSGSENKVDSKEGELPDFWGVRLDHMFVVTEGSGDASIEVVIILFSASEAVGVVSNQTLEAVTTGVDVALNRTLDLVSMESEDKTSDVTVGLEIVGVIGSTLEVVDR